MSTSPHLGAVLLHPQPRPSAQIYQITRRAPVAAQPDTTEVRVSAGTELLAIAEAAAPVRGPLAPAPRMHALRQGICWAAAGLYGFSVAASLGTIFGFGRLAGWW